VGKLLIILTVIDLSRRNIRGIYLLYTSAIIQTLKFRSGGRIDSTYSIVEVEEYRRLGSILEHGYISRRIYNPSSVIRTVYVIPRGLIDGLTYYINNYID